MSENENTSTCSKWWWLLFPLIIGILLVNEKRQSPGTNHHMMIGRTREFHDGGTWQIFDPSEDGVYCYYRPSFGDICIFDRQDPKSYGFDGFIPEILDTVWMEEYTLSEQCTKKECKTYEQHWYCQTYHPGIPVNQDWCWKILGMDIT